MADETNTVDTAAETSKAATAAATETAKKATTAGATAAKRTVKAARKPRKTTARRAKAPRRTSRKSAKPEAAAAANQRNTNVNYNPANVFAAFPAAPFQSLFADAGERSQEAIRRSQQAAEEFADLTRENVEALVDSSRIAAEGARSLGQDVVDTSRESIEQTAEAVRLFAEAKSPTELMQLQGDFARSSFDRMIAEGSRLTESMVKLAGEAFQPISSRASVNAERINKIVA